MKINLPCLTLAVVAGQASLALGADVPVCSARSGATVTPVEQLPLNLPAEAIPVVDVERERHHLWLRRQLAQPAVGARARAAALRGLELDRTADG